MMFPVTYFFRVNGEEGVKDVVTNDLKKIPIFRYRKTSKIGITVTMYLSAPP